MLKEKAKELGTDFFETSAKTGQNVDQAFNTIFKRVHEEMNNKLLEDKKIDIMNPKSKNKKKCCN